MAITDLMTITNLGIFLGIWALLLLILMGRCSYYLNKCLKELKTLNALFAKIEGISRPENEKYDNPWSALNS